MSHCNLPELSKTEPEPDPQTNLATSDPHGPKHKLRRAKTHELNPKSNALLPTGKEETPTSKTQEKLLPHKER
jgi:hypothetical protein